MPLAIGIGVGTAFAQDKGGGAPPAPAAPVNTVLPAISGSPQQGQTLTTSDGTWTGYPAPTYGYQWKRGGANISGATASTYTLVSGDVGANITCTVTATNASGSASATSTAVGPVIPLAPSNTVAPVVSGTTQQDQVLSTTNGTWSNSPSSYAYQWKRGGAVINGATASSYTLVSADVGAMMSCDVSATNAGGSATQASNSVGPVTAPALVTFADSFASGTDGTDLSSRSGWSKVDGGRASQTTGTSSIRHVAGAAPDSAYVGPDLVSTKHYVQCTWKSTANSTTFGIAGRVQDGQNYVGIRRNGSQWQLYKTIAGTFTMLGSSPQEVLDGDVIRMEFDGDNVTCFRNGAVFIGAAAISLGGNLGTQTRCGHAVRAALSPLITNFSCGAMA